MLLAVATLASGCGGGNSGFIGSSAGDNLAIGAVAVVTAPVRVPVMLAEEGQAKRRAAERRSAKPVDCRLNPEGGITGKDCPPPVKPAP